MPKAKPTTPTITGQNLPQATQPPKVPKRVALTNGRLLFNRELSWLDFNWRVLYQAIDERMPLLERARFLAITTNNLDEFFRKRVGGLKRQVGAGVQTLSPDGRTPLEQLRRIRQAVLPIQATLDATWTQTLKPLLQREADIYVHDYSTLTAVQKDWLREYFLSHIFPILTPLAVDPGHPFPFISNLSLSLAVLLRHPKRGTQHFARLKVPTERSRWIPLDKPNHFIALEQVIAHNIHDLFRGMVVERVHAFRITRNADIARDEEEADDLIAMISEELRERRFASVVRLEVAHDMPDEIRRLLLRELELEADDLYTVDGLLDMTCLHALADLDLPKHRFEPWEPVTPAPLLHEGEAKDRPDLFSIIHHGDLLVHHPYESFSASVQRFIEEAADDPQVIAIKQTLYRTSSESPIIRALIRAAEQGKQVAVLVEVKARFDEKNNIGWGQVLEESGVHVTYGLVGLKTHTKTTLVIREEDDGLRAYCHLGTGNYNPKTARLYTDLGLLTCDPDIGYDFINLFHHLTGFAPEQHYRKLLVAPHAMRKTFVRYIRQEVAHQNKHGNGRIMAKMNALDDIGMIQELYRASKAGVQIDLIVRGHCRLRPGIRQVSKNIRVISILGRFLEHSRIYYFHNNGAPRTLIGSADWQRRNLDDRVEAIVEVTAPALRQRLIDLLEQALHDHRSTWDLHGDGRYIQRTPRNEDEEAGYQDVLLAAAQQQHAEAAAPWDVG